MIPYFQKCCPDNFSLTWIIIATFLQLLICLPVLLTCTFSDSIQIPNQNWFQIHQPHLTLSPASPAFLMPFLTDAMLIYLHGCMVLPEQKEITPPPHPRFSLTWHCPSLVAPPAFLMPCLTDAILIYLHGCIVLLEQAEITTPTPRGVLRFELDSSRDPCLRISCKKATH